MVGVGVTVGVGVGVGVGVIVAVGVGVIVGVGVGVAPPQVVKTKEGAGPVAPKELAHGPIGGVTLSIAT